MLEKLKQKEKSSESIDFKAKQNLLGFFDLLLKIDKGSNSQIKIIKVRLLFQIPISIVFIIFAMWLIFNNAYFYSLMCSILSFSIANKQLKKLTIKRNGFSIEFFNPKKYKNKVK